ncbi:hypothetical protein EXIGLDRAFT_271880 [Exidia glandulosa HHB12029]|uniref:PH domain-containing protein n=1 Tax=Exidia glandulosa HHB12029 TaxID=1314781 RepID=A0A165DMB2_EXIGL|nr:hypothetical protein EXIGLDRAFT_271880 [Exidia glandulosa HHB12029]
MSISDPSGGRRTPRYTASGTMSSLSQSSPTRSSFIHSETTEHTEDALRRVDISNPDDDDDESWDDSFVDAQEVERELDEEFDATEQAVSGWSSSAPTTLDPYTFLRSPLSVVPEQSEPSTRSSLLSASSRPSSGVFLSGTWNADLLQRQRERLGIASPTTATRPESPVHYGHSRGATDPGPRGSPRPARDLIAFFEASSASDTSGTSSLGQTRSPSPSKMSGSQSHGYSQSISMPSLSRTLQEASSMHTRSPTMPNLNSSYYTSSSRPSSPTKTSRAMSHALMSPSTSYASVTGPSTMSSFLSPSSRTMDLSSSRSQTTSLLSPPAPSTVLSSSVKSPPTRAVSPRSLPTTSVRNLVAAWTAVTSSASSSEGFFSIRRAAERRARQAEGGEDQGSGSGSGSGPSPPNDNGNDDGNGNGNSAGAPTRSSGSTGSSNLPPSSFELAELGDQFRTQDELQPLRVGVLWYLNVHTAPPYRWQRCQAVLYPNKLLLTWIAPGGGRGVVTLDLLNCTEVRSVPSPTHPSAQDDVGTIAARQQMEDAGGDSGALLELLCPFQLLYADGVERLGAESARERVRWVGALWNAIERAATIPSRTPSPAPTIQSIRSTTSGSGSASTVFVPPLESIPDFPDSLSGRSSSIRSGSLASHRTHQSTRASDDGAISSQGLVVPLGRTGSRLIAPSRSSSLRRTASLTDLDAEFASVARTLQSMGSDTRSTISAVSATDLLSIPTIPSTRAGSPAPSSSARSYRSARDVRLPTRTSESDDVFYSASSASSAAPSRSGTSSDERSSAFVTPLSTPRRRPPTSVSSPSSASDVLRVLSPTSGTQIVGSTLSYRRSDSASLLGDSHEGSDFSSETQSSPSKLRRSPAARRTPRKSRTTTTDSEKENEEETTVSSPQSRTPTRSSGTPTRRSVSGSSRSYSSSYRSGDSASRPPASSVGYDICATSDWTESSSSFSTTGETETPTPSESEPPTPSSEAPSSIYRTPSTHSSLMTERSHQTFYDPAPTPSETGSYRSIPSIPSLRSSGPPSTHYSTAPLCPTPPSTAYTTASDGMAEYLSATPSVRSPSLPPLPSSRSSTLPPLPSSRSSSSRAPSTRPPSTIPSIPSYPDSSTHRTPSPRSTSESPMESVSMPASPPQPPSSPVASLYSESSVTESDVTSSSRTPTRTVPSIMRLSPSPSASRTPSSVSAPTPSSPSTPSSSSLRPSTPSTPSSTSIPTPTPSTVSRTVTSIRASTTPTPSSPHLSVPTTSLLSTVSSRSPSSVSSLSVSTVTRSPIAPGPPSPAAPSFRGSLWGGESNVSYDSSALMPSPSMRSMSLAPPDDEESYESSVLRPTSYATDFISVPTRSLYRAESARSYASSILRPAPESIMGDEYPEESPIPSTVPLPSSPTPTMSASVTLSTPESNEPSIASQLETIPSIIEEQDEEPEPLPAPPSPPRPAIATEEVNRLMDYLRGIEEARTADARDVQDQLGRVEGTLFDLNNFVRGEERAPPVPRKDRSVGRSTAPPASERTEPAESIHTRRSSSVASLTSLESSRLETPASIAEESVEYISSPSSISISLPPSVLRNLPPLPSSGPSSPTTSSSSSRSTVRPPSRGHRTPVPLDELRDMIGAVQRQTENLLESQRQANAILDDLQRRPLPADVDHDLAQRKMDALQRIEDMVNDIRDLLSDEEQDDLQRRLSNLVRISAPTIVAPSPRPSYQQSIGSMLSWPPAPPPPPPSDYGPPQPTPMIVRPPVRPVRQRSVSPVLPDVLPRSISVPPPGFTRIPRDTWVPPPRREPVLEEYPEDDLEYDDEPHPDRIRPRPSGLEGESGPDLNFEDLVRQRRLRARPQGDGIFIPVAPAPPAATVQPRPPTAPPAVTFDDRPVTAPFEPGHPGFPGPHGGLQDWRPGMPGFPPQFPPPQPPAPAVIVPSVTIPREIQDHIRVFTMLFPIFACLLTL